jgi:protein CrcB
LEPCFERPLGAVLRSTRRRSWASPTMNAWIWVALGGGLGSVARYGISLLFHNALVPWDILLINFSGSFCIGIIMSLVVEFGWLSPQFRLFWGVGVMGGYTTFSTYVLGDLSTGPTRHFLDFLHLRNWKSPPRAGGCVARDLAGPHRGNPSGIAAGYNGG